MFKRLTLPQRKSTTCEFSLKASLGRVSFGNRIAIDLGVGRKRCQQTYWTRLRKRTNRCVQTTQTLALVSPSHSSGFSFSLPYFYCCHWLRRPRSLRAHYRRHTRTWMARGGASSATQYHLARRTFAAWSVIETSISGCSRGADSTPRWWRRLQARPRA